MKTTKIICFVIIVGLIAIYLSGVLEGQALGFITSVQEKNMSFLGLVSELKLVFAGLSDLKVPFISGHSEDVQSTINKVEEYLLVTNVISFIQLLLLTAAKSWMLKVVLVALFILSLIKETKNHSKKFLVLAVALGPGLQLFTVAVDQLSAYSSIDFGESYLATLKEKVEKVKEEKSALMREHARNMTKIENGDKGIVFFRKLKEDVSYDFKRLGNGIEGDYKEIRLIISSAGHELLTKVFRFCSMILFSLLLLPLGYAILIYILFSSMFKNVEVTSALAGINGGVLKHESTLSDLHAAVSSFFTDVRNKEKEAENKVGSAIDKVKDDVHNAKQDVAHTFSNMKNTVTQHMEEEKARATDLFQKIKGDLQGGIHAGTQEVQGLKDKMDDLEYKFKAGIEQAHMEVAAHIESDKAKLTGDEDRIKEHVHSDVSHVSDDIQDLKSKVHERTTAIKDEVSNMASRTHTELTDHIEAEKAKLSGSIEDIKNKVTTILTSVVPEFEKVKTDVTTHIQQETDQVSNSLNDVKERFDQEKAKTTAALDQLKSDISTHANEVKATFEDLVANAHSEVLTYVEQEKAKFGNAMNDVKDTITSDVSDIGPDIDELKLNLKNQTDAIKNTFTQMVTSAHDELMEHIEQEKSKLAQDVQEVKDKIDKEDKTPPESLTM